MEHLALEVFELQECTSSGVQAVLAVVDVAVAEFIEHRFFAKVAKTERNVW